MERSFPTRPRCAPPPRSATSSPGPPTVIPPSATSAAQELTPKRFNGPAAWLQSNSHLWLDLGDVKNLVSVTLNGKPLGVTWYAPYRADLTSAKPGSNELKITVYNAWVNRLIGDQQPNATKVTCADITPCHADSPLLPSCLLGSVQIFRVTTR